VRAVSLLVKDGDMWWMGMLGWTQEQIDAMDREKAVAEVAAREEYERLLKEPPTNSIGSRPMTKEELDAKQRAWDATTVVFCEAVSRRVGSVKLRPTGLSAAESGGPQRS
jgi:hypothetical protein